MNTAQPIKDLQKLEEFKNYYVDVKPNMRNHALLTMGLNTALRISDLLALRWENVMDFSRNEVLCHISLVEHKTKKKSSIYMNDSIRQALILYQEDMEMREKCLIPEQYLFLSQKGSPVSRTQAWRIIRKAAESCNIEGVISPHSMRKTFGYHAWKQGVAPTLLMDVYNHSSYKITKRYLGIGQDDRDEVFKNIHI